MGMTFAEKALARNAGLEHLLTHDNTAAIVGKIGDTAISLASDIDILGAKI